MFEEFTTQLTHMERGSSDVHSICALSFGEPFSPEDFNGALCAVRRLVWKAALKSGAVGYELHVDTEQHMTVRLEWSDAGTDADMETRRKHLRKLGKAVRACLAPPADPLVVLETPAAYAQPPHPRPGTF